MMFNAITLFPLQGQNRLSEMKDGFGIHSVFYYVASFVIVGAIVALIIFLAVSKSVRRSKAFTTGAIGGAHTTTYLIYKKIAREFSLNKDETTMLRSVLNYSDASPEVALNNRTELDDLFKARYQHLAKESNTSTEAFTELQTLFRVRNLISYYRDNTETVRRGDSPRSSPRRDCSIRCVCSPTVVKKVKEHGKTVKKFELTGDHFPGKILDISSGGCAMQAALTVKTGQFKIEFNVGLKKVAVLGLARRVNKDKHGMMYHVQFIKVPPKSGSTLNAYVFNYI